MQKGEQGDLGKHPLSGQFENLIEGSREREWNWLNYFVGLEIEVRIWPGIH